VQNLHARRLTPRKCLNTTTLSTVHKWLSHCLGNDKICSEAWRILSFPFVTPSRLLEMTDGGASVRVRATNELSPAIQYLTLSHCWGQSVRCKLLTTNIQQYQKYIPMRDLTRSFIESIHLTTELGFQYLWIDALCIIQDSDADWQVESSKMGDIYARGVLNIAATAARNGDHGLFYSPPRLSPCVIQFQTKNSQQFTFLTHHEGEYTRRIDQSPLASRAWVFQERLLSPRTVQFTVDQAF
jgi:hypothetical protein